MKRRCAEEEAEENVNASRVCGVVGAGSVRSARRKVFRKYTIKTWEEVLPAIAVCVVQEEEYARVRVCVCVEVRAEERCVRAENRKIAGKTRKNPLANRRGGQIINQTEISEVRWKSVPSEVKSYSSTSSSVLGS